MDNHESQEENLPLLETSPQNSTTQLPRHPTSKNIRRRRDRRNGRQKRPLVTYVTLPEPVPKSLSFLLGVTYVTLLFETAG
jgi:hypothetical protein